MMTDVEREDAMLDLIDPARSQNVSRGPELAVLGLAFAAPKGAGYLLTNAGWIAVGDRGRAFQPSWFA